jgi:hypothetical protein
MLLLTLLTLLSLLTLLLFMLLWLLLLLLFMLLLLLFLLRHLLRIPFRPGWLFMPILRWQVLLLLRLLRLWLSGFLLIAHHVVKKFDLCIFADNVRAVNDTKF